MNEQSTPNLAEIVPSESILRHQRQKFWQIIVPISIGVMLILVILALVIRTAVSTGPGEAVSQWADTSVIWLSLPALLFALVLALIMIMMVFLLARLLKILPEYTLTVQHYFGLFSGLMRAWADKLVDPIIAIRSVQASMTAFFDALVGRRRV